MFSSTCGDRLLLSLRQHGTTSRGGSPQTRQVNLLTCGLSASVLAASGSWLGSRSVVSASRHLSFLFDSCPCVPVPSSWPLFCSPLPRGLSDSAPRSSFDRSSSLPVCYSTVAAPLSLSRLLLPPDGYPPPLKTLWAKRRDGLLSIRG